MLTLTMLEKKKILIYNLTQVISTYFIIKTYNRVKIDKGIINTPKYIYIYMCVCVCVSFLQLNFSHSVCYICQFNFTYVFKTYV
jgi:hypothetical protein